MASIYCDVFKHRNASETYLFANIGVMRGHLDHLGWEYVATGVTPKFAMNSIDKFGYHFIRHADRNAERARRFYRQT